MAAVIWPHELQDEPEESGIPEVYQQWAYLISKHPIEQLPNHTRFDYRIEIEKDKVALWGPL